MCSREQCENATVVVHSNHSFHSSHKCSINRGSHHQIDTVTLRDNALRNRILLITSGIIILHTADHTTIKHCMSNDVIEDPISIENVSQARPLKQGCRVVTRHCQGHETDGCATSDFSQSLGIWQMPSPTPPLLPASNISTMHACIIIHAHCICNGQGHRIVSVVSPCARNTSRPAARRGQSPVSFRTLSENEKASNMRLLSATSPAMPDGSGVYATAEEFKKITSQVKSSNQSQSSQRFSWSVGRLSNG